MTTIENILCNEAVNIVKQIFEVDITVDKIQLQKTSKDFEGEITLVVFPLLKISRKSPEQTANLIGEQLVKNIDKVTGFNVVKGFLNLQIADTYYVNMLNYDLNNSCSNNAGNQKPFVIEYSSPNTNKPLHLGHIRNNLLGWSVSEILRASGKNIKKVNLVNDRGIHICKSMLAWQKFSNGETPESSGIKGDHLVGKYYVEFNEHFTLEVAEIMQKEGIEKQEAEQKAPLMLEAQEMLRKWENKDAETIELWKMMNAWVYAGFDVTYKKLGIDFDKIYYESDTYLLGKDIVYKGLSDGILIQKEDSSIWADLTGEGLDEKLLLRKDGTAVYMTQDLGTAKLRQEDFDAEKLLYVVGNEQNYHFDVLKKVLNKLGYAWSSNIEHLSYGMVELPEGKMKSREGTVVDADDLIEQMIDTARKTTEELGKTDGFSKEEACELYRDIALGALKYFMLKVDPTKNMLFNPKESIDFNGNTGPFIQYTHARICSLIKRSDLKETDFNNFNTASIQNILPKEKNLIQNILEYNNVLMQAADTYSPAIIANYLFDTAKLFNGFYQDISILKEENEDIRMFRLALCFATKRCLKNGLALLGINAPNKM